MSPPQYLADFSLALINRTGACYVCRDVVERFDDFFPAVCYWRLCRKTEPRGLMRKLPGRAMLYEFTRLPAVKALPRPRDCGKGDLPTLFLDPLYVLRTMPEPRDIVLCHDVGPLTHLEGAQREALGEGAILVDARSVPAIAEGIRQRVDMPPQEKQRRRTLARSHVDALSRDVYLQRWSDLLSRH